MQYFKAIRYQKNHLPEICFKLFHFLFRPFISDLGNCGFFYPIPQASTTHLVAAKETYALSENSKNMPAHPTNMAHLMGTVRMGTTERHSVVNRDHQVHSVPNLFVVDGSSFTTGAGVNPTSTIMALALLKTKKENFAWDCYSHQIYGLFPNYNEVILKKN
ncbi:GMC family oxidoreductase [Aestuariivivens sediminis]|uniref:GMC family oxidoreductase n=1 Tax=Aestuariivivens sediminis TaxID=2913557 RepID=UPI0023EA9C43|nr:GMC family oxidoreductase [Aestuariivivens sediminis]